MIVVDSSVWIDFFNGAHSAAKDELKRLLGHGGVELLVPAGLEELAVVGDDNRRRRAGDIAENRLIADLGRSAIDIDRRAAWRLMTNTVKFANVETLQQEF